MYNADDESINHRILITDSILNESIRFVITDINDANDVIEYIKYVYKCKHNIDLDEEKKKPKQKSISEIHYLMYGKPFGNFGKTFGY